ncbi:acylphosphatase [Aspergillus neoniger CBS 115656]|uniref:acylphosphatase n=1 Tax=Aspergillus neoniger (strain CBS 115656) TaxID=1448310 RepID=A0A318Z0C6_ASPNB|nr:hypothetical protein BO87DRAFT_413487 [Aspergillus neoniger CBS 115656]PYH37390.1 hypothetical protein BO87DRAFT_413487 [Aspergillus neoniger CBS 115656]
MASQRYTLPWGRYVIYNRWTNTTTPDRIQNALLAKHAAIYRDFTQKRATAYDVKGWVKNTHCGRVEGEAQGTEESLQKFLKDINNGPRHAHVVKLEKKEIAPKDGEVEFGFMKTSQSGYEAMQ